jgi:hypothetical protein
VFLHIQSAVSQTRDRAVILIEAQMLLRVFRPQANTGRLPRLRALPRGDRTFRAATVVNECHGNQERERLHRRMSGFYYPR